MPGVDAVTFTCSRTICSCASTTLTPALARFDSALVGLVESGLLDVNPIRLLLPQRVAAVSRVIRPHLRRLQSRLRDRHLRARNRHAVLVDHRHREGVRASVAGRLPNTAQSKKQKQASEWPAWRIQKTA